MPGRASSFTQKIADEICERIADGESLRAVCRDAGMPPASTVCRWLVENAAFSEQYARARESQADKFAEEIVDIADTEPDPQRARVRVDARKWVAARLKPKSWGDKITNEVTGPNGAALQPMQVIVMPAKQGSEDLV